jgi:hypothetical protein
VDDETPITGPVMEERRTKYVLSREVGEGEIEVLDARVVAGSRPGSAAMEGLSDPESPPAVDPTLMGLRRPRRHRIRYRLAQVATAGALLASGAAVIAVAMADRNLAHVLSLVSVGAGLVAVYLAIRSRMASRILGYAIAVGALAALTAVIIWTLPGHWFEESHPEQLPPNAEVRPKVSS